MGKRYLQGNQGIPDLESYPGSRTAWAGLSMFYNTEQPSEILIHTKVQCCSIEMRAQQLGVCCKFKGGPLPSGT